MYAGADAAVWRYIELSELLSSAQAASYSRVQGRRWADSCVSCVSVVHAEIHSRKLGRWVERCMRCGSPWSEVDAEVPRSISDASFTSGVRESKLAEMSTLGALLSQVNADLLRVYLAYIHHEPHRSSVDAAREVAIRAGLLSPDQRGSERWIRQRVGSARSAISELLQLRGMLR